VIARAGAAAGASVTLLTVPDDAAARAALRTAGPGHATAALIGGSAPTVVVDRAFSATATTPTARLAGAIAQQVSVVVAADRTGLSRSQAVALANPQALPVAHLRPAAVSNSKRIPALASAILVFIIVIRYGFGLLASVVQEKSGRVVELLLPTMRPVELMAGKVIGAGVLVFAQTAVLVITALIAAQAVGSPILAGSGAGALAVDFVWVVLGFLFYGFLFAAGGSLASRTEDMQSVGLPLQIPLFVGYFVAFSALGSGSVSPLVQVLAYLPPTAPLDMPVVAAAGAAGALQVVLSMAITVVGIVVAARVSATIFGRAILHTGTRLKAREVLRQRSQAVPAAGTVTARS
ncbi:MAG: ABC transporter permease, partial [Actinomycetota bacterium]|nr:ABC transporter permease [Actinomycetota bacterium]